MKKDANANANAIRWCTAPSSRKRTARRSKRESFWPSGIPIRSRFSLKSAESLSSVTSSRESRWRKRSTSEPAFRPRSSPIPKMSTNGRASRSKTWKVRLLGCRVRRRRAISFRSERISTFRKDRPYSPAMPWRRFRVRPPRPRISPGACRELPNSSRRGSRKSSPWSPRSTALSRSVKTPRANAK